MPNGFISIVLNAHLPFIRQPDGRKHLEETWFYETMIESYLPILQVLRRLDDAETPGTITISLSAPLLAMMADRRLLERLEEHLDRLVELTDAEVGRRRDDPEFAHAAEFYKGRIASVREFFIHDLDRDLIQEFSRLAESGRIELITSTGTHALLPLMHLVSSKRAQVKASVDYFELLFGDKPRGMWLAECAFAPGIDGLLAERGVFYSFVEGNAIQHAESTPIYGNYSPLVTPEGVVFFGRDELVRSQIWDPEGYSSDPIYRDFDLDIVTELSDDEVIDFTMQDGSLVSTGLKYYAITGTVGPDDKLPYNPERAAERAWEHARHFVEERAAQVRAAAERMEDRPPHITCPFDASFFGHWWFEGPQFLEGIFHHAQKHPELQFGSPIDFLREEPIQQQTMPAISTWGEDGYFKMWLGPQNAWFYRYLHNAELTMRELVDEFEGASGQQSRALRQAARELMLAQSSDWAFIIRTNVDTEYAIERVESHLSNFQNLTSQLRDDAIDEQFLTDLEATNNIFPDLDWQAWKGSVR